MLPPPKGEGHIIINPPHQFCRCVTVSVPRVSFPVNVHCNCVPPHIALQRL